ncbi:MAG: hypothetical protein GX434_10080 [Peptococcaceae bacterium]|nr:hypothetical protein [Peptococcaceae bacterium]
MESYIDLVLFFSIYSFSGWLLETILASIMQRKFINRGFLIGFFCPIYGFGAVLVILSSKWAGALFANGIAGLIISILLAVIEVTVLEYITGYILERIFDCKWWDYSNNAANLKGYICLKYSLLWGLLAFLLLQFVHPVISETVFHIPDLIKFYMVIALTVYFLADTAKSVIDTLNLREIIINYSNIPVSKYHEMIFKYKRFFLAFPRLLVLNAGILNRDVRSILHVRLNKIKVGLKNKLLSL